MNFDWKMFSAIATSASLLFNILLLVGGWYIAQKIMKNDLFHISEAITSIKNKMDKLYARMGRVEKSTAVQKAVCDERHSSKKKKKK